MTDIAPKKSKGKKRALAMFKMHLEGKSYQEIADAFGVSKTIVGRSAIKYNWKARVVEYYQRIYDEVVTTGAKKLGAKVMSILEWQVAQIAKKTQQENYSMAAEDMRELRQLFDLLLKENRLTDNKPTESFGGVVTHRIILPEGVKHFGVDPPGPGVIEVGHEDAEKQDTDVLDLDELDSE